MFKKLLFLLVITAGSATAVAQEVRTLEAQELRRLYRKPEGTAVTRPMLRSKSASSPMVRTEKRRTYPRAKSASVEANTVRVEFTDGTHVDQPMLEVPLLFRVGTTTLLDDRNITLLARTLRDVLQQDPAARFRVEGHASAEGDGAANQRLSEARARLIQQLITAAGVDRSQVKFEGRGSKDAQASATDPESELQKDRRVLVVREG